MGSSSRDIRLTGRFDWAGEPGLDKSGRLHVGVMIQQLLGDEQARAVLNLAVDRLEAPVGRARRHRGGDAAGGSGYVMGHSSGAVLALASSPSYQPVIGALFAQDQIEWTDLTLRAGGRFDFRWCRS